MNSLRYFIITKILFGYLIILIWSVIFLDGNKRSGNFLSQRSKARYNFLLPIQKKTLLNLCDRNVLRLFLAFAKRKYTPIYVNKNDK